jgi:hypothetical protein
VAVNWETGLKELELELRKGAAAIVTAMPFVVANALYPVEWAQWLVAKVKPVVGADFAPDAAAFIVLAVFLPLFLLVYRFVAGLFGFGWRTGLEK